MNNKNKESLAQTIARTVQRYQVSKELRSRNIHVDNDKIEEKERKLDIHYLHPDYLEIMTQEELWVQQ